MCCSSDAIYIYTYRESGGTTLLLHHHHWPYNIIEFQASAFASYVFLEEEDSSSDIVLIDIKQMSFLDNF